MSISVAWGGKNSEDKDNIGFFVRKLNIFESFKPSTLTPKRTSSVRAPSGYPQTHGPRCSRQTREKKKTKIRMFWRFIFTLWPWCLDPSRAPPACFTFLATVTMHVATYLIKSTKLYETTNSSRHVTGLTGLKTYWVLQFLQVTTSTTQEDSHVNLSLSFTPCNR